MSVGSLNRILASVEIPAELSIDDLAVELGRVLGGLTFERDDSGRFEEVPAFVSNQSGVEFILFGWPVDEESDAYVLELFARTPVAIQEFRQTIGGLLSTILVEKEKNSRGFFDYSDELASALCSNGLMARKTM